MRRTLALVAITIAAMVALSGVAGCAARSVGPNAQPKPLIDSTESGTYAAKSRIVLANGVTFTVPAGWKTQLSTKGALIETAPVESGVIGATTGTVKKPYWASGVFSVYGPRAGYTKQLATAEAAFNGTKPPGVAVSKVPLSGSIDASATAYVNSWEGGRREVIFFIEPPDALPAALAFELEGAPVRLSDPPDVDLPSALIDFLEMRVGSD